MGGGEHPPIGLGKCRVIKTTSRDAATWRKPVAIFSDAMSAAEISARVGIEPTIQRAKGDPLPGKRNRDITVVSHQWVWRPGDDIERSLDAQLDAIWVALSPKAAAFASLFPDAKVQLDIWITHRGSDLSLGWVLDRRHVAAAATFGALINIDEYDYTER